MTPEYDINNPDDTVVKQLFTDTQFALETLFKIETEYEGIKPLRLNETQIHYNKNKTCRDVILKPRRRGFSTFILAWALLETMTHEGWTSNILVHKPFAVDILWSALKIMYDNLPEWIKPEAGRNNLTMLSFTQLKSTIRILNAGDEKSTAESLRSGKTNFLHCSEFAFWMWPKLVLTAATPTVPDPPNGMIIIETTANGFNEFRKLWVDSKMGEENYKAHFYSWLDGERYTSKLLPGEEEVLYSNDHPDRLTEEEKFLIETYKIDLTRIKWRRFKMREVGIQKFPQEYPLNDTECFLRTGRVFFNPQRLQSMLESPTRKSPLKRWKNGQPTPEKWRVFTEPSKLRRVVLGGDCAEGLEHGDNDSLSLLDWETAEELIHVWGKLGTDLVTKHILLLIQLFPNILIGIENSKHGQTVLSNLLTYEKVPRKLIYHHTNWDDRVRRAYRKPGWDTNEKSRVIMLDETATMIENNHTKIHDKDKLDEFLSFTVAATGKPQAQSGSNDDTVFSHAIALQMRKHRAIKLRGFRA